MERQSITFLKYISIIQRNTGRYFDLSLEADQIGSGQQFFLLRIACLLYTSNDLIPGNGGGIYVYSNVDVTLEACEISGNTAIDKNSPFIGEGFGGGIYTSGETNIIIKKCTISQNTANVGGGVSLGGSARIENSKVSDNKAAMGGGIHLSQKWRIYDIALEMKDTKVSGNTAVMGGGISVSYTHLGTDRICVRLLAGRWFDRPGYCNGNVPSNGIHQGYRVYCAFCSRPQP